MKERTIQYWEPEMLRNKSDQQTFNDYQKQNYQVPRKQKLNGRDMALVRDRIVNLPRPERLTVYLYFWEEMPIFDIAKTLEIPKGTAKKLLYRGLEQLKGDLRVLTQEHCLQNCEEELAA